MPRKIKVVNLAVENTEVISQDEPVVEEVENNIVVDFPISRDDVSSEIAKIQEEIQMEEVPQPKKRAAPKRNVSKKKTEPVEPVVDILLKTVQLEKCNKCEKLLTHKSLRYSHNCEEKVEKPVKRRVKKQDEIIINNENKNTINIPNEILEKEVEKRLQMEREKRANARKDKIQKIAKDIA